MMCLLVVLLGCWVGVPPRNVISFPFVHTRGHLTTMAVECFDEDTLKAHDLIGSGKVDVSQFMAGTFMARHLGMGVEVPVQLSTAKRPNCGTVVLSVKVNMTA